MTIAREDMSHELLEKIRVIEPDWQAHGEDGRTREEVENKQAAIYELVTGELAELRQRHDGAMQAKNNTTQELQRQNGQLHTQITELKKTHLAELRALAETLTHVWRIVRTDLAVKDLRLNQAGRPELQLEYRGGLSREERVTVGIELLQELTVGPIDGRVPWVFKLDELGVVPEQEAGFALYVGASLSRLSRSKGLVPQASPVSSAPSEAAQSDVTVDEVERVLRWWRSQRLDVAPDRLLATLAGGCSRCGASASRSA